MFASTLLTLFVVPVAYTLLDDFQRGIKWVFGRRKGGVIVPKGRG
jgi:hypothetical protein